MRRSATAVRALAATAALLCPTGGARAAPRPAATEMVRIPAGSYRPLYGAAAPRRIDAFELDARPVTNREYLAFVRVHPQWRRSRAATLFTDEAYLRQWRGDLEPGPAAPLDAPVVSVSWFAARAYLETQGKQLPTVDQWEYAAGLRRVRGLAGPAEPLHEWVLDFNSALVSGDARRDSAIDRTLFCGAAAFNASGLRDYDRFQRLAFRASLEGRYSISSLGFRGVRAASPDRPSRLAGGPVAGASIFALDVPMIDQHGAAARLADLAGHPLVVTMGYARCTSVCPAIVEEMKGVERTVGARSQDVRFVLLSLDPGRDSPQSLAAFAAERRLDPARWRLLAPRHADSVRDLAAVLGVNYAPAGADAIAHSALIVVVDRQGVVRYRQSGAGQDPKPLLDAVHASER